MIDELSSNKSQIDEIMNISSGGIYDRDWDLWSPIKISKFFKSIFIFEKSSIISSIPMQS
jgi:hypothetical protein